MVFRYPLAPHARRHGPLGYSDYSSYKDWLRDEFAFRCVYCLRRERWEASGDQAFGVDHLVPRSVAPARICDYENMVYACVRCNSRKADWPNIPDPCRVGFGTLIRVGKGGLVVPLNASGADLLDALDLNEPVLARFRWELDRLLRRLRKDRTPIGRSRAAFWLGFPDNLPDLSRLRAPGGNTRPGGVHASYFARRLRGDLPAIA